MKLARHPAVIVYNFFSRDIYEFLNVPLGYMTVMDTRDRDIRRILKAIKSSCLEFSETLMLENGYCIVVVEF